MSRPSDANEMRAGTSPIDAVERSDAAKPEPRNVIRPRPTARSGTTEVTMGTAGTTPV